MGDSAVLFARRGSGVFAERNLGSAAYYGNQWANYLYGNDNWRIRPNLTLNLGLRWERTSVPLTQSLQKLNAISDVPGLITSMLPRQLTRTSPRASG